MNYRVRVLLELFAVSALGILVGCKNAQDYRLEADATSRAYLSAYQQEVTGKVEEFEIETPADTLRRRLMLDQNLLANDPASFGIRDIPTNRYWRADERLLPGGEDPSIAIWKGGTNALEIGLVDAVRIAAFNSPDYKARKEALFRSALRRTAEANGLVCLLHEKPFEGVNGSGKHCNWSIAYGGKNLLSPGDNPRDNAIFLTFLSAIIRAVDLHADLLRMSTAGAGNDHRLGANEAPPAIISIFLGDELSAVMKEIETGEAGRRAGRTTFKFGVDTMPALPKDSTDRNRTSPFAFTGNKFEFRAPGSSQNCAASQTVLNTIVAESIDAICDKLDAAGGDFNTELQKLLQRLIRKHKRVLFSGDGYGPEWPKEAAKRNLPNLRDTLEAIAPLENAANRALFAKYGVFSEGEMKSRHEIAAENYLSRVHIEGRVALEIARSMIRPVVADEFSRLATAIGQAKKDGLRVGLKGLTALSLKLGAGLDDLHVKCERVERALLKAEPRAILGAMDDLRKTVDRLEGLVDDRKWPLPKYREILFIY